MFSPRLSPRLGDVQLPTLSNFGCFLPRPNGATSPRLYGNKPPNQAKKALGSRGGVVKERDGFEIFYGVETDGRKDRARRRSAMDAPKPVQAAHAPEKVVDSSSPPQSGTSAFAESRARGTAAPTQAPSSGYPSAGARPVPKLNLNMASTPSAPSRRSPRSEQFGGVPTYSLSARPKLPDGVETYKIASPTQSFEPPIVAETISNRPCSSDIVQDMVAPSAELMRPSINLCLH
mmetsp:Transcript_1252/g.2166  ORF Transcript_1252/g.2166 Transcript_1252/m.2166 type:complete len:233 (-) Transcript_1252:93-791(-)